MGENIASDSGQPINNASDIIRYLDRMGWSPADEIEAGALRFVLGRMSVTCLLDLVVYAKNQAKPLSPIFLYKTWLDDAPADAPLRYVAWFNLGVELATAGDQGGAAQAYAQALVLKSDLDSAAIGLGHVHEAAGRNEEALEVWRRTIQPDEARISLLNQRGRLLEKLGRFDEAERELYRSLLTQPHQKDAFTHWLYLRMKMCAWPVFASGIPGLGVEELIAGAGGLSLLALFDDNEVVNNWVKGWLERKVPPAPARLSPERGYAHDKVRIGYLSSDYNLHPVSMLIAELIETHDRGRFEVYGYCSSRDDGSELRARVLKAFDKWTSVATMGDEQAARLIRADEIDILIDLNGLTEGTRLGILRWKPAPVQVTYLGFVGSMPVPEFDYAIVDHHVVPPELAGNFRPKPLYMSKCYQVNDTKAPIGEPETRESVGLPADRFVFCCFSNNYKISAEIFDAWMRILAGVDNSVLWALSRNPWSRDNMRARAAARGVDPARLIFAEATTPARYLSRLRLADLFLDTFPYNSGTTASDALRMGLPIVTLAGKTFSSRMAASLLHNVGLPEGITTSYDEYVERAIQLGNDRAMHQRFRETVSGDAWRRTIGNIEAFVPEYEDLLLSVRLRPEG
jgi:predicted O-linked N-acetylglucosamine transferase (SPINDLY family)